MAESTYYEKLEKNSHFWHSLGKTLLFQSYTHKMLVQVHRGTKGDDFTAQLQAQWTCTEFLLA